jgi:F-type H+-transporting ATPase subunit epsilon
LRLTITTPTVIAVDADAVRYVRAEDLTGAFGIQPGHADFLTALTVSVVIWRDSESAEHYAAVRGGVLRVRDGKLVEIATREAISGRDLNHLREVVLVQMAQNAENERAARFGALGLQRAAIQQIQRYLHPGEQVSPPPGRKP